MRLFNYFLISLLIATGIFSEMAMAQVRAHSYLLQTPRQAFDLQDAWYRTINTNEVTRAEYRRSHPEADQEFIRNYESGRRMGFKTLEPNWGESTTAYRPAFYFIQDSSIVTNMIRSSILVSMAAMGDPAAVTNLTEDLAKDRTAERFLSALVRNKSRLMSLYNLRNDTYNKFVAMAFGILGNETKFGTNWKYPLKENSQWLVSLYKNITTNSDEVINSRGLTQIKYIPEKIKKAFPGINPNTISVPENAAVTTLGYLAETMNIINGLKAKQRANGIAPGEVNLDYITDQNIFDYIPYVYSGRMNRLFNSPNSREGATVVNNNYINEMKRHMRNLFFMEIPSK